MTCMKFSEHQLEVLNMFMNVNPSIVFKPGQSVSTISNNKNILGVCTFKNIEFERKSPIYDLGNMMKTVRLLSRSSGSSAEVVFTEDRVDIRHGGSTMKYYYADERMITQPPEKINSIGEPAVITELSHDQMLQILQTASQYQLPDLCFQGKEGHLYAIVTDKRNATSNTLEIDLGETDRDFCFCVKIENIAVVMMGGSACKGIKGYKIELYERKVAKLYGVISETAASTVENLEFMIALEPDSEY